MLTSLRRLYVLLLAVVLLATRVPWWTITNLTPAQRPRRSWTLSRVIRVCFARFAFNALGLENIKLILKIPSHAKLETGKGVQGVYVDGAPELITGKLQEWAEKANVGAERIPGYWIHKKGTTIAIEAKPQDEKEKVLYHLHGGAYVTLSAHPRMTTSNIPRGVLKFCEDVKRSFAIEYRLSSIPPAPTAGQFPSALIDALAGYNYLVNKIGYKPTQIVVAGDSAGGNLAQALVRYLAEHKDNGVPGFPDVPGSLILLSPWCDMSGSLSSPTSSVYTNAKSDYIKGPKTPYTSDPPRAFIEPFGLDFTRQTPYLSPACSHLADADVSFDGFPRTFVVSGDAEVLLDQIRELARRMKGSMGERVRYHEAKDAFHDYICMPYAEPERSDTLIMIAKFVEQE